MKDVIIKTKAIPAQPRSKNYSAGSTVVRTSNGMFSNGGINKKEFISLFDDELSKWFVRDTDNKGIYPAAYQGEEVGFYSNSYLSAKGYSPGSGGGVGGASALYQLVDVIANSTGTGVEGAVDGSILKYDALADKWKAGEAGLNENQLAAYLSTNNYAKKSDIPSLAGYVTEKWVTDKGYLVATASDKANWNAAYGWGNHALSGYAKQTDLNTVSDKLNSFLSGESISDTIDNWKEFQKVFENFPDSANMVELLRGKVDITTSVKAGTGLTGGGPLSKDITLSLGETGVSVGTYTKLTVDKYGRVTSGTSLIASDIPSLAISKITGLQDALNSKLNSNDFQSKFDTAISAWFVRDEGNKGICPATYKGEEVGFYSNTYLSAKGYASGSGGGGGGASALYQLLDVIPNASGTGVEGVADGYVLAYDALAGKWKAAQRLDETALKAYLTTNKYATQGWVSSQGYLTQHQSLANYVTLNTDQNITGIKTFVGSNFSFYHTDGNLNIVQKSSYTGGWARGLNFKNDNDVQYAVIGGYGNVNTFNYVYIGQSYDSRWITFASTGVKSSVDLEATKFKKTGGTSAQFLKADGSIDSNSYLTTVSASSTYVRKAGDTMTGGLTINGSIILNTDWIRFNKNTIGLYSETGDARWLYNGTSWAADKAITSTSTITGTRLISNVAQGTAPLTVTSTTLVNNLNADLLDNYHASGLATANTVVIRDGNNYTYLKYINSSTNTDENGDLDQFIVTKPNDSFYRKYGRDYVRTQLNKFSVNRQTIDLSTLDANTYYPCSIRVEPYEPTTINIFVSLNSGTKPSWSTHTSGFTMNLSWQVFGGGWGITGVQRKILNNYWQSTSNNVHPCGGIEQNTMASTEIVYLRGGGKYFYTVSNNQNKFEVNTSGYTWSSGNYSYSAALISAPKKSPSLCYEGSSMFGAYNIYCGYLQTNQISVDGIVTAETYKSGKSMFQDGQLELSGTTPYIDFHYGNSTADYTHRIIAETADRLNITTGLQVNGVLYGKDELNIGSTMLSGVKPTTTNTITNVFNASTVLAMELYTVNKDSAQPLFRWANNISTGYTTRYSIGSVRAVGDGFGQLRLWVGNNDVGTTGNWFALNNNGVVSTSTTYFETSNTGFKTGNVIFAAKGSVAEISSATNHLLVSGYSDIHVNYTASGTGRTIPTKWYWHKGAANTWADFEIGALITHGNVTINGITSVNGNLDVVGDIGSTGGITSTRMLATLGGLDVTDNAMFNNDATFDGTTYFNDVMNINTAVTLNGDVALNGTIRGNSSSKIICDGIGISASNKESGCIISGNPSFWNIVFDHNDIQARNNGAWSILYINDYGGDVSITNSSATYSAKILSTKASTAYNNGALTVGGGVGVGGSIYVRNNVVVNGAVTAKEPSTSDIRLKDNIRDFNASLILKEIGKPFTFEWNSLARELNSNLSNEHQNFGVSAQRVKEVLPGFAFECYEGGYLGVKYERFMPIVMAAQLETMGEVEILKRRVKELEDEIKILKKEV